MAKVRCKACQNEVAGYCNVKKIGVAPNKPRNCEAFIFAEGRVKAKAAAPVEHIGFIEKQRIKAKLKADRQEYIRLLKEKPANGTARDLGLDTEASRIIMPGDSRFSVPRNIKHPLTGDLSRFKTTADVKLENTHASKVKV